LAELKTKEKPRTDQKEKKKKGFSPLRRKKRNTPAVRCKNQSVLYGEKGGVFG